MSDLPPLFRALLLRAGLPLPEREVRFHPTRKWRLDYAWCYEKRVEVEATNYSMPRAYMGVSVRVALEVEGGVWTRGRHTRGSGYLKDLDKYNALAVQGWRLLRVTPKQLATPATITLIRGALES